MNLYPYLIALALALGLSDLSALAGASPNGASTKKSNQSPPGEEYIYKSVDQRNLKLYVLAPANKGTKRPAIVFFHGGAWTGGKPTQFNEHCKYFASRGMVTVQVEYRLLDRKTSEPPVPCVHDAKSAMRWVRQHANQLGIDPDRIAAGGGSAGGHLAAFVGMVEGLDDPQDDLTISSKANALVLFNPVFDNGPGGWGHNRVKDQFKEFSPFHNISPDDPPAIVFLGTNDKLIPVSTVEDFKQRMERQKVKCDTHFYEGQPHGFFNHGRSGNKYYDETVKAADGFLAELGWINGPPTLSPP